MSTQARGDGLRQLSSHVLTVWNRASALDFSRRLIAWRYIGAKGLQPDINRASKNRVFFRGLWVRVAMYAGGGRRAARVCGESFLVMMDHVDG